MTGRLSVDTETISAAGTRVRRIQTRLESAQADADSLSGMIPVSDLRNRVMDFSEKWEINRKKMIEEIGQLHEQLQAISDGFCETDSELARSLNEAGQQVPQQSASGLHIQ